MKLRSITAAAYEIPTASPESDGTATWESTTLVAVEAAAGDAVGFGYTYTDAGAARIVNRLLAETCRDRDAFDIPGAWMAMLRAIRNLGPAGVASMAASAVDAALWDLKARLLGVPLARLLGLAREQVPIYGSGGFTSYSVADLEAHMVAWVERGARIVKMKVGREPSADAGRVAAVRKAIGPGIELLVDGNGAYSHAQALALARFYREEADVTWFEEPVSSEDLAGLRRIRNEVPAGIEITAGEYGHSTAYFRAMLEAEAVDVLQADATRCVGLTGFLEAGALCRGFGVPLSSHCAPALHLHAAAAVPALRHIEYFFDHMRIETRYFDGMPQVVDGCLAPDLSRPGNGLTLKRQDLAHFAV